MINRKIIVVLIALMFNHPAIAAVFNKEDPVYYFVNKDTEIQALKETLSKYKLVGITGISGIGKSELARKYVERYQKKYKIIAFLDTAIDLVPQFLKLARYINQHIIDEDNYYISENPEDVKDSLMEYLKPKRDWLLIFDNLRINENGKVKDFIEWYHNGHIIICSQDTEYLVQKVIPSYLDKENISWLIKKIMENSSKKFLDGLVQMLDGHPTHIIAHSAIFLQNNNHITIEEYRNYMKKHENKTRAHLKLVLRELNDIDKDLLYNTALLNNQKAPRFILKRLCHNQENFSNSLDKIIRFGLIEQINISGSDQVFRMHEAIKSELLEMNNIFLNRKRINIILNEFISLIPTKAVNQFIAMANDSESASNIEVLLANADKYKGNIYKIMELRNILLGYYLRSREAYNAKNMITWFNENKKDLNPKIMTNREKLAYSRYLGRIGRSEYFVANKTYAEVMNYLAKAREIVNTIEDSDADKSAIYFEILQIQIHSGDIPNAEANLQDIQIIIENNPALIHKASMLDYGRARILLSKGKYQEALTAIVLMLDKENSQLENAKTLAQASNISKQEIAWLAPIYALKAEILNNIESFNEAYSISESIYNMIKDKKEGEITSMTLAYILIELSRAELGLKQRDQALKHSKEAITLLLNDKDRNNKDLEESHDEFLALALIANAEALAANGQFNESIKHYKTAKSIFEKSYGFENIKYMDNASRLLLQASNVAANLPVLEDRKIWCSYFYKSLVQTFGREHPRTLKAHEICQFH